MHLTHAQGVFGQWVRQVGWWAAGLECHNGRCHLGVTGGKTDRMSCHPFPLQTMFCINLSSLVSLNLSPLRHLPRIHLWRIRCVAHVLSKATKFEFSTQFGAGNGNLHFTGVVVRRRTNRIVQVEVCTHHHDCILYILSSCSCPFTSYTEQSLPLGHVTSQEKLAARKKDEDFVHKNKLL